MRLIHHLCVLLLLISTVSSSCLRQCGKISIPFPFGIGRGCYHNDWYEVKFKNFVPFLRRIKKEVVQIDLPRSLAVNRVELVDSVPLGSLRIKTKVSSLGCNGGERPEELVNLTGTPFLISSNQTLVAFGCNNKRFEKIRCGIQGALIVSFLLQILVGFSGLCNVTSISHIIENFVFPSSTCSGHLCCKASTPTESSQKMGVKVESMDGNTTRGGCRVAFITDQFNQPSRPWVNITDPKWFHQKGYSTVTLEWAFLTRNMSFEDSLRCSNIDVHSEPCYCGIPLTSGQIRYLTCACANGYEGNPYVVDGCKDVDECTLREADGSPKYCPTRGETCLNVPGRYRCVMKEDKSYRIYIGVGVGSGVLLIGAAFWLYKLIKKHIKRNLREKCFRRNGGMLLEQQLSSGDDFVENTMVFTSKELEKATEGFSLGRVLGRGGQGTVFKGMLTDGRIIAVKRSSVLDEDRVGEFINELIILSQLNHQNIVRVLGCCLETEVPLLVYEFISNGNLLQRLQEETAADQVLTWEVRVKLAKDIARGLSYLHSVASPPVFHKDIKSANIMIDDKFRAKLADFGTSRVIAGDHMSHMTTVVSGTPGYIDPQFYQSGRYTDKSDVYSYGVVLAELVTGRRPYFQGSTLASLFLEEMKEKRLLDIVDPRIRNDCDLEQVVAMASIASSCLNLEVGKRPTMILISLELERTFPSLPDHVAEEVAEASSSREPLSIDLSPIL